MPGPIIYPGGWECIERHTRQVQQFCCHDKYNNPRQVISTILLLRQFQQFCSHDKYNNSAVNCTANIQPTKPRNPTQQTLNHINSISCPSLNPPFPKQPTKRSTKQSTPVNQSARTILPSHGHPPNIQYNSNFYKNQREEVIA